MAIQPDYGLAMLEQFGVPKDTAISFADFALSHISNVGPSLFSTLVGMEIESVTHALSLDFDAETLGQILGLAEIGTANTVLQWTERGCVPSTLELDAPIHFAVECQFGSLEENDKERYVPLIVQRVQSIDSDGTAETEELLLFSDDDLEPETEEANLPRWEYYSIPHLDFIGAEKAVAFSYSLAELERSPGFYTDPVIKQMMMALSALSGSKQKGLRNQAFTIYGTNNSEYGVFVLAIAAKTAPLVDFVAHYLRDVPGHRYVDSCTSVGLMPLYRYDNGHVIQYSEEGLEGTYYKDTIDNFGSGLTIHQRIWLPAEDIGRSRSIYGKLVEGR